MQNIMFYLVLLLGLITWLQIFLLPWTFFISFYILQCRFHLIAKFLCFHCHFYNVFRKKPFGSVNLGSWPRSGSFALKLEENRSCPRTLCLFTKLCCGVSWTENGQPHCSCYGLAGFIGYRFLSGHSSLSAKPAGNSCPWVAFRWPGHVLKPSWFE